MKLNLITTAAVLAFAGAMMTQSAKAQFSGVSEDLILSFTDNVTTDQGTTTNYEIDLGQYSLYANATTTLEIANIGTDLSSIYGSGYFANANLQLGILGVNNVGATAAGVKNQSVFVSTTGPLDPALKASTLGGQVSQAAVLYTPAINSPTPVAGSTLGSYEVSTSNGASFGTVFTKVNFPNELAAFGSSTAPVLSLDILQPGASAFVTGTSTLLPGTFDVTSTGEVEFQVAAVPEPSTYALMVLGGLLLFWQFRRKSVSTL